VQNCQNCHKDNLSGQPPAIPSIVGIMDHGGAEALKTAVRSGMSPMPAFPDLSSTDIDDLIAYIRRPE